jgi:hypothetical protein
MEASSRRETTSRTRQPEESGPRLFSGRQRRPGERRMGGVILSTGAAVSLETWRSGFDASWSTAS